MEEPPFGAAIPMDDFNFEQLMQMLDKQHEQSMQMLDKLIELKSKERTQPDEEVTSIDDVIRAVTPDGSELPGR